MHLARRKNQRAIRSEGHCFALDRDYSHPLEDVDNLLALMEVRRSRGTGGEASVSMLPLHGFHQTCWR
jgi:hypothetical protein